MARRAQVPLVAECRELSPPSRAPRGFESRQRRLRRGAEKDRLVRGFTKKVLTVASGRSVGATDRETVDGIVQELERNEYGIQWLLQAVVASEAFRMK
ncbi:MAG TPA: DUF1585 domain-containing protein [Pirellulales bacterium]|nr:DUF1585 domain-containing protein [Pirellulales bacterium]